MKPRSESLFHFTRSLDVLKLILKSGISPRYCLEDLKWLRADLDFVAYAMSCFCDIPLSRIDEHTSFYGQFGIGLTKEWGIENGLNPVCYVPDGGALKQIVSTLAHASSDDKKMKDLHISSFVQLMRLIKPLSGEMIVGGEVVPKEFYQESEWRYTPDTNLTIRKSGFENGREQANIEAEKFTLEISPNDIRYIIVPSDEQIPSLVDFLNTELGHFPLNDIKVMQTRIVTLNSILTDM